MFAISKRISEILCNVKLTLIFSAVFLSSCSAVTPLTPSDFAKSTLIVQWAEPHKIHFQGKGVGAGIALMSTMGAMGMAIGAAIDEGISKQLTQAQLTSNKQLKSLIIKQAEHVFSERFDILWRAHSQLDVKHLGSKKITIKQIGFKLRPGHTEGVCGEVIFSITSQNNTPITFHYPNDITVSDDQKNTACVVYELEKLKTDKIYLNQALSGVLDRAFLMSSKHITPESFKNNKG